MARAKTLTAKHLEIIDGIAAFFAKNDRNAELVDVMVKLMAIGDVPGAGTVLAKRIKELQREAKRDAA